MVRVGLVMLQGARHAHISALNEASEDCGIPIEIIEIRKLEQLHSSDPDALIIPGGESTTMRKTGKDDASSLMPGMFEWIRSNRSKPILGTCAGAILLADPQDGASPLINAVLNRNAYGSQYESFQGSVHSPLLDREFPGIFIRAPRFVSADDDICATHGDEVVGVKNGMIIGLTFHPELSPDRGFHKWIIENAKM